MNTCCVLRYIVVDRLDRCITFQEESIATKVGGDTPPASYTYTLFTTQQIPSKYEHVSLPIAISPIPFVVLMLLIIRMFMVKSCKVAVMMEWH